MLSCMIDAKEERDVATADVPGEFLQTDDISAESRIRLDGIMAELLAKINPELYQKLIFKDEKGRKVLYGECLQAICGTLNAALLFWLNMSNDQKKRGFTMNQYDSCVINNMIDGKQCTILWHMDDIKVPHVDPNVVKFVL